MLERSSLLARAVLRPAVPADRTAGRGQDDASPLASSTRLAREGFAARLPGPDGCRVLSRPFRQGRPGRLARRVLLASTSPRPCASASSPRPVARARRRRYAPSSGSGLPRRRPGDGRSCSSSTRPRRSARSPTSRGCARCTRCSGGASRAKRRDGARHVLPHSGPGVLAGLDDARGAAARGARRRGAGFRRRRRGARGIRLAPLREHPAQPPPPGGRPRHGLDGGDASRRPAGDGLPPDLRDRSSCAAGATASPRRSCRRWRTRRG